MNWMDKSEQAYKNGFRQGYIEGLGDRASELLDGAIRWHKKKPDHDEAHCFVVYQWYDGSVRVYLGAYSEEAEMFHSIDYIGTVNPKDPEFVMWGEYRPVSFTSPGMDG